MIYFFDCVPAENGGLMLSVELTGCSEVVQVLHGTPQYTVGCIVFVPTVSQTKFNNSVIEQVYYSYDFGDGQYKQDSTEPNITHCYNKTGTYNYSVNAIGVFMTELLSLHTNLTDHMELLGKLQRPPLRDIGTKWEMMAHNTVQRGQLV